jgi:hypothetical protein
LLCEVVSPPLGSMAIFDWQFQVWWLFHSVSLFVSFG